MSDDAVIAVDPAPPPEVGAVAPGTDLYFEIQPAPGRDREW
jgi:hypothetical protein